MPRSWWTPTTAAPSTAPRTPWSACADAGIYWFEEPFGEDPALNADLKQFIRERGYATLVADGESGPPPPTFFAMVEAGDIDVVQHDFRMPWG